MGKIKRINTKYSGVFYRESITNNKEDKTYYIRYKDEQNKDKEVKIGKYSEGFRENFCNQKRNEIITQIRIGEEPLLTANKKKRNILSLETLAKEYFDNRADNNSKKSDFSYYSNYISIFFKDFDLNFIDRKDIKKFIDSLVNSKTKHSDKFLAAKTVNNILNLFKAIIKFSFKHDLIKNDITKYIELLNIDNARERFLSKEDIKNLYKYSKHDETLYLLFKLALNTGARLSSLLNLSKKDIDFTHEFITLKDFKNNSTYKAFLTKDLNTLLTNKTKPLKLNDNLFPTNPERRLRSLLNDLFNNDVEEDDRKNKVVFHSLRHTFASHLAINGTPIFTIQKLMNHKDIKMTLRYAKLSPDSGREAVNELSL